MPLPPLLDAGAPVALGADDPLLFGSRLAAQYEMRAAHGLTDAELAELARMSFRASAARLRTSVAATAWLAAIDTWLALSPRSRARSRPGPAR